jgi:hypothetical protein
MSEPEAIGASIAQLRVECIGMALGQEQLTIPQRLELAAHLVALMEHGAQLKPAGSGATWWLANALPAPPPGRETVAEAVKRGADDVLVPGPPPAKGFKMVEPVRWTDERKALLFRKVAEHEADGSLVRWPVLTEMLNALPGAPISKQQAQVWWHNCGKAQARDLAKAARGGAPEAVEAA